MRQLVAVLIAPFVVAALAIAAAPDQVEVKGPHICCKQCVNVVGKLLDKVEGVSDVKADSKTKTVTFKAKDGKAATAGVKALVDGGFFGKATLAGKEIKIEVPAPASGKADVVTVKDVHVCCGACQNAIKKVFPDAKVSFDGKGPQRTVRIEGKGLDRSATLETLHKAGFNGKAE